MADDRPLRAAIREALRAAADGRGPRRGDRGRTSRGAGPRRSWRSLAAPAGDDGEAAAVARALVAPHGGRVEDEAVPGRGRTLRIVLPLRRGSHTPRGVAGLTAAGPAIASPR